MSKWYAVKQVMHVVDTSMQQTVQRCVVAVCGTKYDADIVKEAMNELYGNCPELTHEISTLGTSDAHQLAQALTR